MSKTILVGHARSCSLRRPHGVDDVGRSDRQDQQVRRGGTLPSSSCGPLFYKGSGKPQFIVASDLPLQGAGRAQNLAMGQAIRFVLEKQYNFKVGKYTVGYQECDDSTAAKGAWDPAKCSANGRAYASDKSVIGVLGTFNSGCSKLMRSDPQPGAGRRRGNDQLGEHQRRV